MMAGQGWLLVVLALVAAAAVAVAYRLGRGSRVETPDDIRQLLDAAEKLRSAQDQLAGRMDQSEKSVNERLESLAKRLGDGMTEHTRRTGETLKGLHERLAVIDTAQKNITDLSQQMVGLQDILANKQARGAFGEIQLRDLVAGALPPTAYEFQATLSNGKRADCLLKLPNPPGSIAIDSKFPLESYEKLRSARDDAAKVQAEREFSAAVRKHVLDIAERYVVPGETAESALMFLPSEAVYAELHANFRNVVEESFRRRVWIVSPTTLMATLTTVRAILKDALMREQAGVIQQEVIKLLEDVGRLDKRVDSLESHFGQAQKDIRDIRVSADKVVKRGARIDGLQFEDDGAAEELPASAPPRLKEVER